MGLTFNLGRVSPSVFTDSSLNVGIGAAPSGSYKLEVTGTAKVSSTLLVSGALSGTSATFSSDLSVINTSNALLKVYSNTTSSPIADIELMRGTNTTWGADAYTDYRIRSSAGDLLIQSGESTVTSTRLTIASTGAATFSSNIFAGGSVLTSSSGADTIIGAYGGQDCSLILQDSVQLWELYVNDDFYINYGATSAITIKRTTGNVGIGTTSLSGGRLVISGDNGGTSTNTQMQVNTITSQVSISCYDPVGSAYKRFTVYSLDVRLSALGSGTVSSNADGVLSGSDGRLKNKTRPLENGLEKVLALVPTYFKWKEDSPFYTEQDYEELGFIAQEVGAVIPEASPEPETNKVKNFHDRAIIAALVKGMQEQQIQIQNLQEQNQDLKSRLDKAGL